MEDDMLVSRETMRQLLAVSDADNRSVDSIIRMGMTCAQMGIASEQELQRYVTAGIRLRRLVEEIMP